MIAPFTSDEIRPLVLDGKNNVFQWMNDDVATFVQKVNAGQAPGGHSMFTSDGQMSTLRQLRRVSEWSSSSYSPRDEDGKDELLPLERGLSALAVGDDEGLDNQPWTAARLVSTGVYPQGPNVAIRWEQNKGYHEKANQKLTPPTDAFHLIITNPIDGVIVVQRGVDARYKFNANPVNRLPGNPAKLLTITQWSDLAWYQWLSMRDDPRQGRPSDYDFATFEPRLLSSHLRKMTDWLNYVVVQVQPEEEQLLTVISTCIRAPEFRDSAPHEGPYRSGAVPTWHERLNFMPGHWCYYALLRSNVESPNLLIRRKYDTALGKKFLFSVTIYWPDAVGNSEAIHWPVLEWAVCSGDCPQLITQFFEQRWDINGDFVNTPIIRLPGPVACGTNTVPQTQAPPQMAASPQVQGSAAQQSHNNPSYNPDTQYYPGSAQYYPGSAQYYPGSEQYYPATHQYYPQPGSFSGQYQGAPQQGPGGAQYGSASHQYYVQTDVSSGQYQGLPPQGPGGAQYGPGSYQDYAQPGQSYGQYQGPPQAAPRGAQYHPQPGPPAGQYQGTVPSVQGAAQYYPQTGSSSSQQSGQGSHGNVHMGGT